MRFFKKTDNVSIKNKKRYYFNLDEGVKENLFYVNGLRGGTSIVDKSVEYISQIKNACKIEDGFVVYGEDNLFSIPEDAEITILYDAGSGFTLNRLPFDRKYYNWDTFWDE